MFNRQQHTFISTNSPKFMKTLSYEEEVAEASRIDAFHNESILKLFPKVPIGPDSERVHGFSEHNGQFEFTVNPDFQKSLILVRWWEMPLKVKTNVYSFQISNRNINCQFSMMALYVTSQSRARSIQQKWLTISHLLRSSLISMAVMASLAFASSSLPMSLWWEIVIKLRNYYFWAFIFSCFLL